MKKLDVQDRLESASAGVAVLRSLQITDRKMTYSQFADAIGLISGDDGWKAWHRKQVSDILYLLSAAEAQGGKANTNPLAFDRITDKKGQHGKGLGKKTKIVKT